MAFVLAVFVFIATIVIAFFVAFAYGMSDNPANNKNPISIWIFLGGTILAILIALTHYGPHLGW
jgi:hypothetical protein